MQTTEPQVEWCLLQNQFDSYEKHSLYIKLVSVIVLLAVEIFGVVSIFMFFILLVLWIQDAIWKTFQSRIESRLLAIEKASSDGSDTKACQFNSEYRKVRLTGLSLIFEYAKQAIRPTVAFPHVALILILLVQFFLRISY